MPYRVFAFVAACICALPASSLANLITFNPPGHTSAVYLSTNGNVVTRDLPETGNGYSVRFAGGALSTGELSVVSPTSLQGIATADTTGGGGYAQSEVDYLFSPTVDLSYELTVSAFQTTAFHGYGELYDLSTGSDILLHLGEGPVYGSMTAGDVYGFDVLDAVYSGGLSDGGYATLTYSAPSSVPEPTSISLFAVGVVSIAIRQWQRRKQA